MKNSLTLNLRQKITLAFLIVILLLSGNAFLGFTINRKSKAIDYIVNEAYYPIIEILKRLDQNQVLIIEYSKKWILNGLPEDRQGLKKFVISEYPDIRVKLGKQSVLIDEKDIKNKLNNIIEEFDVLVQSEEEILNLLTTKADFENNERYSYCKNSLENNIIPGVSEKRQLITWTEIEISNRIKELQQKSKKLDSIQVFITFILTGIMVIILVLLVFWLPGLFINRLKKISETFSFISQGNLPEKINVVTEDEIGEVEEFINLLGHDMKRIKTFIEDIGKGNFNTKAVVYNGEGVIGTAFEKMRESLIEIARKQDELRKGEEIRNWVNTGIAHFNEILRIKNDNIDELSYDIVKELVKYTGSIIGGVYILKKESGAEILEMSGLFAYERKRYMDSRIMPGEGLIGTTFVEKHKIYLREIPDDYIKISSGLGEAPPRELLIIPMIHNENIYGVLELATLETYNEKTIGFIERIAEGLASTISSVIINTETARLLDESKEKAEKLHSQEEELRQNMEEMQAAQEESVRLTAQLEGIHKNLESILEKIPNPVFVKDEKSKYILVNTEQLLLLGLKSEQLIGKKDEDIISNEDELVIIKNSDFDVIQNKKKIVLPDQIITLENGSIKRLRTVKIPVLNHLTNKVNILGVSYDLQKLVSE